MSKNNHGSKKLFLILVIVAMIFYFYPNTVYSGAIIAVDLAQEIDTNFEACFGFGATTDLDVSVVAGDVLEMDFTGWDLTNLTIDDDTNVSEVSVAINSACTTGLTATEDSTSPDNNNNRAVAEISGDTVIITFEDDKSGSWSVKFLDKTDGNSFALKTPSSSGSYLVTYTLKRSGEVVDVGADLFQIGSAGEIVISAEVEPSLTLSLTNTPCTFDDFDILNVKTCSYDSVVSTNATGGYIAYVRDDGNLRNTLDDIDDVSDGAASAGVEEYGIATDFSFYNLTDIDQQVTDCSAANSTSSVNSAPLTIDDQTYAGASEPVSGDTITLCHSASISGITPAGVYSHNAIITVVGNY